MKESGIQYILLIFGIGLLTGCGSNGAISQNSNKISPGLIDSPDLIKMSCAFTPNEGNAANFSELGEQDIREADFGKTYNHASLIGILSASLEETLKYIPNAQVQMFRTPRLGANTCDHMTQFLSPAQADLMQQWNNYGGQMNANTGGTIVGLYLPIGTTLTSGRVIQKAPVILVRSDMDRWTPVHEFMHHLFFSEAQKSGWNPESTEALYTQSMQTLESGSKTDANTLQQALLTLVQSMDGLMIHYALEEVAVERVLQKEYSEGNFQYVSSESYENSQWYISENLEMANNVYQELKTTIQQTVQKIQVTDSPVANDINQKTTAIVQERISQIQEIIESNTPQNAVSEGYINQKPETKNLKHRCAGSAQSETMLSRLKKLNRMSDYQ